MIKILTESLENTPISFNRIRNSREYTVFCYAVLRSLTSRLGT